MLTPPNLQDIITALQAQWGSQTSEWEESGASVSGRWVGSKILRELSELAAGAASVSAAAGARAPVGELAVELGRVTNPPIASGGGRPYAQGADVQTESAVLNADGVHMAENHHGITVVEEWHESGGREACSIVIEGKRARVFQRAADGPFYLRQEGSTKNNSKWRSLRTSNRDDAILRARELLTVQEAQEGRAARSEVSSSSYPTAVRGAAEILGSASTEQQDPNASLTLRRLVDAYWAGAQFEANSDGTKATKVSSARILLGYFGGDKVVEDFTDDEFLRYRLRREKGGVEYTDYDATPTGRVLTVKKSTEPVKKRAVASDLKFLRTMINWAVKNWKSAGLPRITSNPIAGFQMPREKNPTQRTMPYDRYLLIREAAQQMVASSDVPHTKRLQMRMFLLAFEIAEAFGRRAGSIGGLLREDFHLDSANGFANAYVEWRWEKDKTGATSKIPLTTEIAKLLWTYCQEMPLPPSGRLFWKVGKDEPLNTNILNDLFHEAERAAGLLPIPYMVWHSVRRKWATERKDLPINDSMAVGGWLDAKTFLAYQKTDPETMLAVLEHGPKLHSDGWLRTKDGSSVGAKRAVLPGNM